MEVESHQEGQPEVFEVASSCCAYFRYSLASTLSPTTTGNGPRGLGRKKMGGLVALLLPEAHDRNVLARRPQSKTPTSLLDRHSNGAENGSGRVPWEIKRPPSLKKYQASLEKSWTLTRCREPIHINTTFLSSSPNSEMILEIFSLYSYLHTCQTFGV